MWVTQQYQFGWAFSFWMTMQAPYIGHLQVIDPSFETFVSINVTLVFTSFDPSWPEVSKLVLWFPSSWSGSFFILSGQWRVDSWSLLYMINLANISPTSFLTKMRHYFTSGTWFTTHPLRSLSSQELFLSLSPNCTPLPKFQWVKPWPWRQKPFRSSFLNWFHCLPVKVGKELLGFLSLAKPPLCWKCDIKATSHMHLRGIGYLLRFQTVRILVSATFNWKKERSMQVVLGGGMQRDRIFLKRCM